MPVSQRGLQNRSKYHEDSTKVSIVSVSRRASPPQRGQGTRTNFSSAGSGERPPSSRSASSGRTTGRSCSGTGTMPQRPQWIIGMGAPQ